MTLALLLLLLCGCKAPAHRIDYGSRALLSSAPAAARAGEIVSLTARTSPGETAWLFLDGAQLLPERQDALQAVFSFPMPDHAVRIDAAAAPEGRRPKLLLAEYLERENGKPYYGVALYTCSETQVILEEFAEDEAYGVQYYAPAEMAQEILQFFREERLSEWAKERHPIALDPEISYVIRYPEGGAFAEVSTDAMPPDGAEVFELLYEYLMDYLDGEFEINPF